MAQLKHFDNTDAELEAIAKSAPLTTREKRIRRQVKKFIKENNITPGETRVEPWEVYYYYCKWTTKRPTDFVSFSKQFKKFFYPKKIASIRFYRLVFNFNLEDKFMFRRAYSEYRKKQRHKREQKTKQKTKNKISRTCTKCKPQDTMGTY